MSSERVTEPNAYYSETPEEDNRLLGVASIDAEVKEDVPDTGQLTFAIRDRSNTTQASPMTPSVRFLQRQSDRSSSLTELPEKNDPCQRYSPKIQSARKYEPSDLLSSNLGRFYNRQLSEPVRYASGPKLVAPPYVMPSVDDLREIDKDVSAAVSKEGLPKLTNRQRLTICMLAFANFCSTTLFSMIAPFFPREAAAKGASEMEIGLIFGIFELCIFISSPIFGRYITKIGPKFLYTTGLLVTGCTAVLFGVLNMCPPGPKFIGLCFAVRSVEALGDAAFITAAFSIIASEFRGRVATMIGMLETFSGLGFMAGPALGGALYQLGGFGLPFFLSGSLLFVAGLLSIILIPTQTHTTQDKRGSILKLLAIPSVTVMMTTVLISAISLSFMDPTLQPHLENYHLTPLFVGLMFLLISGVYTMTAPAWGWFLDKKGHGKLVIAIGTILMVAGFLLVGPSPALGLPSRLWITALGLVSMGFGIGAQLIPPFTESLSVAKLNGYPDNFKLYGMVSGLFQSSMSLGAFIGPTVGGAGSQAFGFGWASTMCASLHLCLLMVIVAFLVWERHRLKSHKTDEDERSDKMLKSDTVLTDLKTVDPIVV